MLKIQNISKSFDGSLVLDDVSFEVQPAEILGLVGPSGAGKTVLLKIIGSVLEADAGSIRPVNLSELGVGFLFQEGALFDSLSVLENVAFPLLSMGRRRTETVTKTEAYERSYKILTEVGLKDAVLKMPGQLSGGMRRRVALARALVSEPQLLLLDDPTGGLDPVAASVILELILMQHRRLRPTVIMVSHDLRRLLPNVERVIALFEGKVVSDLRPNALIEKAPAQVLKFLRTRFDFDEMSGSLQ